MFEAVSGISYSNLHVGRERGQMAESSACAVGLTLRERILTQQRKAIKLNSLGISMMERGHFAEATDTFKHSLALCRSTMVEALEPEHDSDRSVCPWWWSLDETVTYSHSPPCNQEQSSREGKEALCAVSLGSGVEHGLYQKGIDLPLRGIGWTYRACSMVTILITFNLALNYHLASIAHGNDVSLLERAAKFYQLAFTMQEEEEEQAFVNIHANSDYREDTPRTFHFTLTVLNNLGLAQLALKDYSSAHHCFEYVLSTLLFLRSYERREGSSVHCHVVDIIFQAFFRNANLFLSKGKNEWYSKSTSSLDRLAAAA